MKRELAKTLKTAGFPIAFFQAGHRFYPNEHNFTWSAASRNSGVTITPYELQNHIGDIADGYYCPTLPDLIEACGQHLVRLYVEGALWTAESNSPHAAGKAHSAEEAVARLWLTLHGKPS